MDISGDALSLIVDKVSMDDEATYTVRKQGSEEDLGEITLTVISDVHSEETDRYVHTMKLFGLFGFNLHRHHKGHSDFSSFSFH